MGFLKKTLRKFTRPVSRVLDKIVPNEIKPALPYLAAFTPYMLPGSGILSGALRSAGANAIGQLAQEGNEGELNALSLLLAGVQGAGTAKGAGDYFRSGINKGVPATGTPGVAGQEFSNVLSNANTGAFDTSGLTGLDKAKNFMLKGGVKLTDLAGDASETLRNPFEEGVTLKQITEAAAVPSSQATGDLAYAQGIKEKKDFDRTEAAKIVEQEMRSRGLDQGYIDAITSSMNAYGYTQAEIDEILEVRNLATGGRVGYGMGGDIMEGIMGMVRGGGMDASQPDFNSMAETVENVDMKEQDNMMFDEEYITIMTDDGPIKIKKSHYEAMPGMFTDTTTSLYGDAARGRPVPDFANGGLASVLPQGMEMDYRGGGFIPMGSKERADDVPARVSKNEFVMTADAVRAAGGGSVNKGAKRMYEMMNNLEARV